LIIKDRMKFKFILIDKFIFSFQRVVALKYLFYVYVKYLLLILSYFLIIEFDSRKISEENVSLATVEALTRGKDQ